MKPTRSDMYVAVITLMDDSREIDNWHFGDYTLAHKSGLHVWIGNFGPNMYRPAEIPITWLNPWKWALRAAIKRLKTAKNMKAMA